MMPDRKEMMAALDEAFAEQMKTLFGVLASSTNLTEATPRFVQGLSQARVAYLKASEAIAAMANVATG
jgi:hypothetical protein